MRRTKATLVMSTTVSLMAAIVVGSAAVAVDEAAEEPLPGGAALEAALERLPDADGAGDAAELRALVGPPDAFTVALEPAQDGSVSRREEWFYYDLATVFELADGQLLTDWPLSDIPSVLVHPVAYDPAAFEVGATWDSLADVVGDASSFESLTLEEEYGIPATVYVGDFLLLAFDEDGELFYVEALPLSAGADE